MQREFFRRVRRHNSAHVGAALAYRTKGVIGCRYFAISINLNLEAAIRFLLDGREDRVLEEAGSHAAKRLMVTVSKDAGRVCLRRYCRRRYQQHSNAYRCGQ